jgi:AraC-like DNA-binding protein
MSVLIDEDNVLKIKKERSLLIWLSRQAYRNRRRNRVEFKEAKNGFQTNLWRYCLWISDYKMDFARKLLDSGSYNVNEVGLKIGYSTGSHFIAAFKICYHTKKILNVNKSNT